MNSVSVAVAGAGIGGLAAALALSRADCTVRVLEQTHQLAEVGAGVQLGANAVRVLQHLEDYRRSGGTVVLVTHGAEADRFATQRLRLEAGRRVDPVPLSSVHPSLP